MLLKKNNKAYSLAEIMISLALMTVLLGLVTSRVLKQSPDIEKVRVKKAYVVIEKNINSMINNDVVYSGDNMFRNLEAVTTSVGDQFGVENPNTKFRDAFMYYLTVVDENLTCDILVDEVSSVSVDNCFKSSDGVVYGIPDTDFETVGVFPYRSERVGAREHMYVPITVYPNFENKQDVEKDTMLIGVRFDGKIMIFPKTEGCDEESRDISCNVLKFLHSSDIKREEN